MDMNIRFNKLKIRNLKNVKYGEVKSKSDYTTFEKSDVIGIYGQNASGKTAVVDAFKILYCLLEYEPLNIISSKMINIGATEMELNFEFNLALGEEYYLLYYTVVIDVIDNGYHVKKEELKYKENLKGARPKRLLLYEKDDIKVKSNASRTLSADTQVNIKMCVNYSNDLRTTAIFNKRILNVVDKYFDESQKNIYKSLYSEFSKSLHIVENVDYGLLISNLVMPFTIYNENVRGTVGVMASEDKAMSSKTYDLLKNSVFPTINSILPYVIPGLIIEIEKVGEKLIKEDEYGVLVDIISNREGVKIPLRNESDGVRKIISILSVLNSVFNNKNACVVIDELDSGIFEYLLGGLLSILHESGRGQLIFTSHNLRILEMLPIKNLWFTTTEPNNRYIQLKNVSDTNNNRDVYLRAIQLMNQDEPLYDKTHNSRIKRAFKMSQYKSKKDE